MGKALSGELSYMLTGVVVSPATIVPMHRYLRKSWKPAPEVIKLFSCSTLTVEHEILNAHKYKNIKKFSFF